MDFNKQPFLVIWETTHACDLACVHCRAVAEPLPHPDELSTSEAKSLISQVKEMGTPIFIFSGGDPLKRGDLNELIQYAHKLGLRTGAIPAVTPLVTRKRIEELKKAGLDQIAFSLDAPNAKDHDAFRQVAGVFDRTIDAIGWANELGLAVQINSLINLHNTDKLDELISLIENFNIVFWEVFFLVPMGRGKDLSILSASKFEEVFEKIYSLNKRAPFIIKVTEAPHYRRFYFEKEAVFPGIGMRSAMTDSASIDLPQHLRRPAGPGGSIGHAPQGVNSGKGFLFVSYLGDVMPSGFLPIKAGNMKENRLEDVYQNSPLFKSLRDMSLLKGRCGACSYKDICGGSRSRAYAMTGDYLQEDPYCAYDPSKQESRVGVSP